MSYYQSGEGLNLLERAAAVKAPTITGTVDANYPASNLYSGRPSQYAKWSAPAASTYLEFDLNLVQGGDAEAALDASWASCADTGTPTLSQSATTPYAGTKSNRVQLSGVASGAHTAAARRTIRLRAGEKVRLYAAGIVAVGDLAAVTVRNLETGLYLTSAGAWAASGDAFSTDSASWDDAYITFTMPGDDSGLWQRVQVSAEGRVTSGTEIDVRWDVKVVPGWDTLVMLGHSSTPAQQVAFEYAALDTNDPRDAWAGAANVPAWIKSTDAVANPFPSGELRQAAVWNRAAVTRYERWIRFYLVAGAVSVATVQAGELILCQSDTLPREPRPQVSEVGDAAGQVSLESGAGDPWTYNRTPISRARLTLKFQAFAAKSTHDDTLRAARSMFVTRTHAGRFPVLVMPYEYDPGLVVFGKVRSTLGIDFNARERLWEVEVQEYPIPGLHGGLFL